MKNILKICEAVADLCATARPKKLEGQWRDIVESSLYSLKRIVGTEGIIYSPYHTSGVNKYIDEEDVPVFNEDLVRASIQWRWLRRNGLPYDEEFNEYCEILAGVDDEPDTESRPELKKGYITRDKKGNYWWWKDKPYVSDITPNVWVGKNFELLNPRLFCGFPEIPDEEWDKKIIRIE